MKSKFLSFSALALTLSLGVNGLFPKTSNAMVIGILSGNVPLAVAGGLLMFPGAIVPGAVAYGIGYGPTWLLNGHHQGSADEVGGVLGTGTIILAEIAGLILDANGKPVAVNVTPQVVDQIGTQEGYSPADVATIKNDMALIDRTISQKDPALINLHSLFGTKDVGSDAYQSKYADVLKQAAGSMSDKVNSALTAAGEQATARISETTAQFILSLNGVAN